PEAAHPYYQVTNAGYEVEFASPLGGAAPLDPSSVEAFKGDEESMKFLNDAAIKKQVENTKKVHTNYDVLTATFPSATQLSEVQSKDYKAIFYVGGHGPIFGALRSVRRLISLYADPLSRWLADLYSDPNSLQLIDEFWRESKPVAAVCHGPVVFIKAIDTATGEPLLRGKKATCFSNKEEEIADLVDEIPFLVESQMKGVPCHFQNTREPWGVEVVTDESVPGKTLITGANPASASETGKALIKAIKARE
ncbi:SPOSA6832_00364, partial [Sporobolomyces salmonicolor]